MALCVSSHVSVNFIQVSFFLSCSPAAQSNFCLPSSFSNFVSLHRTGKSISLMPQSFISLMPQSFSGLIYVGQQLSGKHKSFLCYQELKKKILSSKDWVMMCVQGMCTSQSYKTGLFLQCNSCICAARTTLCAWLVHTKIIQRGKRQIFQKEF